jgi:hypothetical protein
MRWIDKAADGLLILSRRGDYQVRVYKDRLAISRNDGDRLTWEELQKVKQEVWGDAVCIEVYPAESDVVNLRHTRHLWCTPEIETLVSRVCKHPEFE